MSWITDVPTVDHSTLAAFAECPHRAVHIARGLVEQTGKELLIGQAVHDALSLATRHYLSVLANPIDLAQTIREMVRHSRPDLQPEALDAIQPSLHAWAAWMYENNPRSGVMRFDGGEGDRSGQLSRETLGVVVTSEVDLLLATASPELVRIVDYKTGWTPWDEDSIERSLQFQLHAWLIWGNYPEVEDVDVQVWLTRFNRMTRRVRFSRRKEADIQARIEESVKSWLNWKDSEIGDVPKYVVADKCRTCPVLLRCDSVTDKTWTVSPEQMVDEMAKRQVQLDAMHDLLSEIVEKTGRDIVSPAGHCFGTGKPKSERKPTKALYKVK